ncbi:hypothetical protein M885DRAFT_462738, partial [Pelagophyceae sp. CCMP2097]
MQNPGGAAPFHSASLYVGDLAPDASEGLLFEIFNTVGPVASIRVCRDAVTRRSLGYAYVNFHNVSDAERALETMNYTLIKNKPCRIMWSQRDPTLRKSGVGNVFVKNLDASIDHKALFDTFSLFGSILSCKVATDEAGRSQGYGYVHYETEESASDAIAKINNMTICDKDVYVGHFVRRTERSGLEDWTNLYVKNFPPEWTEAALKSVFEKFGAITSCKLSAVHDGSAFGWVNFDEHESAVKAMEVLNSATTVDAVVDGASASSAVELKAPLFVGRAQKKQERMRELSAKFEAAKVERIKKYQGVNLFVKNLDDALDDDGLREHFAPFGTITSARVMRESSAGASRGFGFVCFASPEEATKAVSEMNNKLVLGKPIFVALAQRKEVRRAQLEAQHAQRRAAQPGYGLQGLAGAPPAGGGGPMGPPHLAPHQGFSHPHHYGVPMMYHGAAPQHAMLPPGQAMPPQFAGRAQGGYVVARGQQPRAGPLSPQGLPPGADPRNRQFAPQHPGQAYGMHPGALGAQQLGQGSARRGRNRSQQQGAPGAPGAQQQGQQYKYTQNARNAQNAQMPPAMAGMPGAAGMAPAGMGGPP